MAGPRPFLLLSALRRLVWTSHPKQQQNKSSTPIRMSGNAEPDSVEVLASALSAAIESSVGVPVGG